MNKSKAYSDGPFGKDRAPRQGVPNLPIWPILVSSDFRHLDRESRPGGTDRVMYSVSVRITRISTTPRTCSRSIYRYSKLLPRQASRGKHPVVVQETPSGGLGCFATHSTYNDTDQHIRGSKTCLVVYTHVAFIRPCGCVYYAHNHNTDKGNVSIKGRVLVLIKATCSTFDTDNHKYCELRGE